MRSLNDEVSTRKFKKGNVELLDVPILNVDCGKIFVKAVSL